MNGRPADPSIRPIDWAAIAGRDPPPRLWWIQDWLTPAPTLLAGAGGSGKSHLMQTIGTALATGSEYLEAASRPLRVLIWGCEDDADEVWRRQVPINSHFGVEMADLDGRLHIVPRVGRDNRLFAGAWGEPNFTTVFDELREQVNDLGADILVLDNIAQVFGANQSDPHLVTAFVNGVYGIVRDRPFAPIFLGHIARAAGSEFAGSAAWENACRMRWYLGTHLPDQKLDDDEPTDSDVVYLAKRKANYTAKDYRRLRFEGGLLVPDHVEGRRFDHAGQAAIAERVVLKGLAKLREAGIAATDGRTSPDYLPTQMVAKGLAEGHGRKDLASAMNRLMGNGRLKRDVVGRYANRAPRYGLVEQPM